MFAGDRDTVYLLYQKWRDTEQIPESCSLLSQDQAQNQVWNLRNPGCFLINLK
jgi:hypothetical protein